MVVENYRVHSLPLLTSSLILHELSPVSPQAWHHFLDVVDDELLLSFPAWPRRSKVPLPASDNSALPRPSKRIFCSRSRSILPLKFINPGQALAQQIFQSTGIAFLGGQLLAQLYDLDS